jgi:hypothetical protein
MSHPENTVMADIRKSEVRGTLPSFTAEFGNFGKFYFEKCAASLK